VPFRSALSHDRAERPAGDRAERWADRRAGRWAAATPRGRVLAGLLAGLLTVAALVVLPAGSAAANDLDGASPSAGAKLKSAPDEIRLDFAGLVLGGAQVSVSGPDGSVRGNTTAMGRTVTRSLRGELRPGTYSVNWSVRSLLREDTGSYSFSIVAPKRKPKPKPKPTTAEPTPSKTPTAKATTSAAVLPTVTHSARPTPRTDDDVASPVPTVAVAAPEVQGVSYTGSGRLPSPIVLWGLLMVAILIGSIVARIRRNTRN
jgi:copper resistance protein C